MNMKNLILRTLRPFVALSFLAAALPACRTDAEAVCDYKAECEGHGYGWIDDCYYSSDREEVDADYDGCLDYYDDLQACEYETGWCKGGNDWETSCGAEKDRYNNCRN
jgi:hypothetical protein